MSQGVESPPVTSKLLETTYEPRFFGISVATLRPLISQPPIKGKNFVKTVKEFCESHSCCILILFIYNESALIAFARNR